jgi:hypothetical protein
MSPVFTRKITYCFLSAGALWLLLGCQPAPPSEHQHYAVQAAMPQTRSDLRQALADFAGQSEAERAITSLRQIIQSFPALSQTPTAKTAERLSILDEPVALIYTTLTGEKITENKGLSALFEHPISRDVFGKIPPEVYVEAPQKGIIGYHFRHPDKRVYVILNLSYDHHEVPFPLGFMTSTKISIWQTDAPQFETFVTQQPLSIRPRTAIVVVV